MTSAMIAKVIAVTIGLPFFGVVGDQQEQEHQPGRHERPLERLVPGRRPGQPPLAELGPVSLSCAPRH